MNTLAMRIKAMFSHQKAVSIDSLDLSGSDGTMPLEMLARVLVKVVDEHDDIRYQINNEVDSSAGKQTNRTRQGTDNGRQELPRHIVSTPGALIRNTLNVGIAISLLSPLLIR